MSAPPHSPTSPHHSDYQQALSALYALSPKGIQLDLSRVLAASQRLGDVHQRLRAVQIAGTNGKGTVTRVLAHAAHRGGLRVGMFTSPHLHRFAERVQIDGQCADDDVLARALGQVLLLTRPPDAIPLTFFEAATLCALLVFAQAQVDIAFLEVGLGGRLDATSAVPPVATAITSIGLDHTALLGDTEAAIAAEKAAIARPGIPMFTGALQAEAHDAVAAICRARQTPLRVLGRDFHVDDTLTPPWPGAHQRQNAHLALAIYQHLQQHHFPTLDDANFRRALDSATWPGRFERIGTRPTFLLDGAHNMPAARALLDALDEQRTPVDTLIFGALSDKPFAEMFALLRPICRHVVCVAPPIQRAFDAAAFAQQHHLRLARDMPDALQQAARLSTEASSTVLVTGSFFTVAEARRLLTDAPSDPPVGL
ncbi:MAG: Mur ligase family protein [Proteobacteria bacterium]|nr:Mur ligase family protein [Pseudomonadota bacterium]